MSSAEPAVLTESVPPAAVVTEYQTSVPIGPQLLSADSVVARLLLPETPVAPNASGDAVAQVSLEGGPPIWIFNSYWVESPPGACAPKKVCGGVTCTPMPPITWTAYHVPAVTEPV